MKIDRIEMTVAKCPHCGRVIPIYMIGSDCRTARHMTKNGRVCQRYTWNIEDPADRELNNTMQTKWFDLNESAPELF